MLVKRGANSGAFADLQFVLEHASTGFYIFATQTSQAQSEVLKNLSFNKENVFFYDYKSNNERFSYDVLANLAVKNPDKQIFVLLNFQLALKDNIDIMQLNLSRDALNRLNKTWLFGVLDYADFNMAKYAIDFYSQVMMKIYFKEEVPAFGFGTLDENIRNVGNNF